MAQQGKRRFYMVLGHGTYIRDAVCNWLIKHRTWDNSDGGRLVQRLSASVTTSLTPLDGRDLRYSSGALRCCQIVGDLASLESSRQILPQALDSLLLTARGSSWILRCMTMWMTQKLWKSQRVLRYKYKIRCTRHLYHRGP